MTSPAKLIKSEIAQRELARRRLLPFILRFEAGYKPGWVHRELCEKLENFAEAVIEGKSPRLMVFMPPRSGKSTIISKYFPAWFLGQYPDREVILTSYAMSLAQSFSKQIRAIIRDPLYHGVYPQVQLDPESQAAEEWQLLRQTPVGKRVGGRLVAAGVGGGVTGKGAHCLIVDDPVKNAEDAESETMREKTWDWFMSTAYTRLAPGGGVIIVMTRWHEDDLGGRLEQLTESGEIEPPFEVIRYPAIAEEDERHRRRGEALHPDRYDLKELERIRKTVGPRVWSALYQQRPAPEEGAYFTRDMIRYYEPHQLPRKLTVYATWDLAIGKKERNDYTVGLKFGVDEHDQIWILDMIRGRFDALEIVDHMLDMWQHDDRFDLVGIEKGHIQMTLGPLLDKRMAERRLFRFTYEVLQPGRSDKEARARSIQGRMRQGMVLWPMHAAWMKEAEAEILSFPHAKHDDVVDALAYAGIMLDQLRLPPAERRKRLAQKPSWRSRLRELMNADRKRHWLAS